MFSISQLAQKFGLSRSTLLYYDKIGLLSPSQRSLNNYRRYSNHDAHRLKVICSFREAGIAVKDIRSILESGKDHLSRVLKRRLQELSAQAFEIRKKQQLLASMLQLKLEAFPLANVNRELWVEMLQNAGIDEAAMQAWHSEFEKRAPQAHQEFLLSLGISAQEIQLIRAYSRKPQTLDY